MPPRARPLTDDELDALTHDPAMRASFEPGDLAGALDPDEPPVIALDPDVAETRFERNPSLAEDDDLASMAPDDEPEDPRASFSAASLRTPMPRMQQGFRAPATGFTGALSTREPTQTPGRPTAPPAVPPPAAVATEAPRGTNPADDDRDVEPDNDADDVAALVPDEDEALPPRERARRSKMLMADAFGPTADERARLDAAHADDERRNRRGSILRGIGKGLTALGLLSGSGGVAAVGAGLATGGAALRGSDREEQERARVAERLGTVDAQREAENAAAQREQDAARQAQQDELAGRRANADIDLARARTEAIGAETSQSEAERVMARQGAGGLRGYIRARVAAIPNAQTREPLERQVNDPSFDTIEDPASLYRVLASVDAVDRRRGGQGVGGSGGGGRLETTVDANGNVVSRRVGGAHGSPGGAPAEPGARAAASTVGAAGDLGALDVNDPAVVEPWIQRTLNRADLRNQDTIAGYLLRWRQAPSDAARAAVLTEVSNLAVAAERDDAGGIPAGVDRQDWQRMRTTLTPLAMQRSRALDLAGRVRSWSRSRPAALQAAVAISGGGDRSQFDAATLTGADDILREIARYVNPLLRERSGAAVTDSELRRMLAELNAGRWTTPPSTFVAAIERQVDDYDEQIRANAADFPPRAVEAWAHQHLGGR